MCVYIVYDLLNPIVWQLRRDGLEVNTHILRALGPPIDDDDDDDGRTMRWCG